MPRYAHLARPYTAMPATLHQYHWPAMGARHRDVDAKRFARRQRALVPGQPADLNCLAPPTFRHVTTRILSPIKSCAADMMNARHAPFSRAAHADAGNIFAACHATFFRLIGLLTLSAVMLRPPRHAASFHATPASIASRRRRRACHAEVYAHCQGHTRPRRCC